jgi:nitroimidazol reductase NimA-like FMN-containing flavoprotein (pyridoxamine 5'-phosphate oxidase superfamily)
MIGQLTPEQIEDVLRSEVIARIACVYDGRPYIVPVTYVYDGESAYVHSAPGAKILAMRENPNVCFEVEQIRSMANWRTVVAQGTFEELFFDAHERALDLLAAKFDPLQTSESARPGRREDVHRQEGVSRPIVYRIRLQSKTGRFEQAEAS